MVRSVPANLKKWIKDQAHESNVNQNKFVISKLQGLMQVAEDRPLFAECFEQDSKASVESFPFAFIDLFAGIGGFRIGLEEIGGKCVFTSEWDKFSQQTYAQWFGEKPMGDINNVSASDIPNHDVLAAGFPCQPFSIAGVSKKQSLGVAHGFQCEKQGNLFFKICEIADEKQTPVLILENVKNLKSHDKKRTWQVIETELEQLGYSVFHKIIDAAYWVPQHRERIFIVCFRKSVFGNSLDFQFPIAPETKPEFSSILESKPEPKYTLSDHLWQYLQNYKKKHEAKGNGFGFGLMTDFSGVSRTLSARYHKDGSEILISQGGRKNPRRLTIVEAARLMGYGDWVKSRDDIPVSDTQAYRQFGNSVVPAVVSAVGREVLKQIYSQWLSDTKGCILNPKKKRRPREKSKRMTTK
jgi:DNA (cytosine-5)-methyltransferase 1